MQDEFLSQKTDDQQRSRVSRSFCGYDQHLLHSVAAELITANQERDFIDMSDITVVVSGNRVERRLMELLVIKAKELSNGRGVVPPRIVTRGGLIEAFMHGPKNVASEVSSHIAWMTAIKTIGADVIAEIIPDLPQGYLERSASSLARRIDSIYTQINSAGLSFSDVAIKGAGVEGFYEEQRWEALQSIYQKYVEELQRVGLECRYAARSAFLEKLDQVSLSGRIYLCGLLELTEQSRVFLRHFEGEIRSFIFAESRDADGFDALGAIIPEYWGKKTLPLSGDSIHVIEHPRDIAPACIEWIGQIPGGIKRGDLVLGLGDEQIGSFIKGKLRELGLAAHLASGIDPLHTNVGFLLEGIFKYVESRSFLDFSCLIRHPYITNYLNLKIETGAADSGIILDAVDCYQQMHLQASTDGKLPHNPDRESLAIRAITVVEELLAPLFKPPASAEEWGLRIFDVLQSLASYLRRDPPVVVNHINNLVNQFSSCTLESSLRASEALGLFIDQFEAGVEIADKDDAGVELLGWLELAFDDSPALILTGLDEEVVPSVTNSDSFLPDSLSRHIGLPSNSTRYARDVALFTMIIRSKRHLRVLSLRRNLKGDVVQPSRLLLACDLDQLSNRVAALTKEGTRYVFPSAESGIKRSFIAQAPAPPIEPVERMSVTAFASYLRCPYRFYLERVAQVAAMPHDAVELDPFGFGNLAHEVLSWAAKDARFNSSDRGLIEALLDEGLKNYSRLFFGKNPLPAVKIQIDQLRQRFLKYTYWHVSHRSNGWKTIDTEFNIAEHGLTLEISDAVMNVSGRIDRIDRNEGTGEYLILDYKTGDKPKAKGDICTHKRIGDGDDTKTVWSDLQAPLYIFAAKKSYGEQANIRFGYINISASPGDDLWREVELSKNELDDGFEQAREIAQQVHDGIFWPPAKSYLVDPETDSYWRLLTGMALAENDLGERENE